MLRAVLLFTPKKNHNKKKVKEIRTVFGIYACFRLKEESCSAKLDKIKQNKTNKNHNEKKKGERYSYCCLNMLVLDSNRNPSIQS